MKKALLLLTLFLTIILILSISVNAHAVSESHLRASTGTCPLCNGPCTVTCGGTVLDSISGSCHLGISGCYQTISIYYNRYSCPTCGVVQQYTQNGTHTHEIHTKCHYVGYCPYLY